MTTTIYRFGTDQTDGDGSMREVLGGKGAGLSEMTKAGLPVPPGFIIPTTACLAYMGCPTNADAGAFMKDLMVRVEQEMARLTGLMGYSPLVSVRSGARVSMPGMMDTILNVGMTSETLPFWKEKLGPRAALDSYRRLIQMFGSVALGRDKSVYEKLLHAAKKDAKVEQDKDIPEEVLQDLVTSYLAVTESFPDSLAGQLLLAIQAVFKSWNNERAVFYRKQHDIPNDWGTAVIVQTMVFGNLNDESGSGVLFTRNPSTGEDKIVGEFLPNAQGEDVVAGIRTPLSIEQMWPDVKAELTDMVSALELHYREVQDVEFTVQDKKLWLLQTRTAKRTSLAAFKIAVDMVNEGLIGKRAALKRLSPKDYFLMKSGPMIAPGFSVPPVAVGLPGCPGVVAGTACFSSKDLIKFKTGKYVLVTKETNPDDIKGMAAAVGVLTAMGGFTSHAAVVARGMNKPCVVGCGAIDCTQSATAKKIKIGDVIVTSKDVITIDGATGRVWVNVAVPMIDGSKDPNVQTVLGWLLEIAGKMPASAEMMFPAQRLLASDWYLPDGMSLVGAFLQAAAKAKNDLSGILLDLTRPSNLLHSEDETLLRSFGGLGYDQRTKDIVSALVVSKVKLAGVVLDAADSKHLKTLRDAGYVVNGYATTVADLLGSTPLVATEEFIQNVIGGQKTYELLVKKLELAPPKSSASVHVDELVCSWMGK